MLFDSSRADLLPEAVTLRRLAVEFSDPEQGLVDSSLEVLIYVSDLASPKARVQLCDLAEQGGPRPLNVRRRAGEIVQLHLVGVSEQAPGISVTLEWRIR